MYDPIFQNLANFVRWIRPISRPKPSGFDQASDILLKFVRTLNQAARDPKMVRAPWIRAPEAYFSLSTVKIAFIEGMAMILAQKYHTDCRYRADSVTCKSCALALLPVAI